MQKRKQKSLSEDLIDLTVASAIGGTAAGIVGSSNLPQPIRGATSSLIGIGLVKGATDIATKKRKRLI